MATITNKDIKAAKRATHYRIKEFVDSDGDSTYYVQRKYFGIWLYVYAPGEYDSMMWIFEVIFGSPKQFYTIKAAKDWIRRRVYSEDVLYHYYPF